MKVLDAPRSLARELTPAVAPVLVGVKTSSMSEGNYMNRVQIPVHDFVPLAFDLLQN
jgi:hypothetical protein